ncbi:MAG: Gx transporter family protein [Spirochaetaceae bacterium]|jgi:uncharacterized membrane protein|nr:Gx transporter family protein [Spirochaetaceae bacterium]
MTRLTPEPGSIQVFGALGAFLSVIEYLFPKPLPFLRLGLANMPLMLALNLDIKSYTAIALIKVVAAALLSGTLFSYIFLFSAAGTLASAIVMRLLWKTGGSAFSFAGAGVAGAMASNICQLALARFFVLGKGAWYIAPPFLAAGIITGFALGIFCNRFSDASRWYRRIIRRGSAAKPEIQNGASQPAANPSISILTLPNCVFIAGGICAVFYAALSDIRIKGALFAALLLLFIALKKKTNYIFTLIFFVFIVFFNILVPYGKVLWNLGGFCITEGALAGGLSKAFTVQGLIFISRLSVSSKMRFPGKFGSLLAGTFLCLERINERKGQIDRRRLIASLDSLLLGVQAQQENKSAPSL